MVDRLTSLAAVKDWLGLTTDSSDAELTRLVDAASTWAYTYMNRGPFAAHDVVETVRGNGKDTMLLREWPILSVASVGVQGSEVKAATIGHFGLAANGYVISDANLPGSPQSLNLFGSSFWYKSQVQIVYRAGYEATEDFELVEGEDEEGEATGAIESIRPGEAGSWLKDFGVLIDGVAALKVTKDPQGGEYSIDAWGNYSFNIADKDKVATISYGYVPWDIAQAVAELVGETMRYKDRIGVKSKSLAGQETVSYFDTVLTPTVSATLSMYRNVVPY